MAHPTELTTIFRIGTVNVHLFRNSLTGKRNTDALASILAPYNLDVLAVEEAYDDSDWRHLREQLSLTHSVFGPSHGSSYGNAIASRHPIVDYSNQVAEHDCTGGYRAMLQCRFGGDHSFVQNRTFAVTHLDYLDEDDRLIQIAEFSPHDHNINILIGDMNALTRNDYSDTYFREIVAGKRERVGWERPRFELTNLLTDTWGFQDAFRQVNPTLKDEHVATCPYGTRIDYIFQRPLRDDEWILTECSIVDTHKATDHSAVVATFEHKSNLKR